MRMRLLETSGSSGARMTADDSVVYDEDGCGDLGKGDTAAVEKGFGSVELILTLLFGRGGFECGEWRLDANIAECGAAVSRRTSSDYDDKDLLQTSSEVAKGVMCSCCVRRRYGEGTRAEVGEGD